MLLSERQVWWGLGVALTIAAFSGVAFARSGNLESPAYLTFWLSMTAAWAMAGAAVAVEAHHQIRWLTVGVTAGLLLLNPLAAFFGGWLLAVATWPILTLVLLAQAFARDGGS